MRKIKLTDSIVSILKEKFTLSTETCVILTEIFKKNKKAKLIAVLSALEIK